MQQLRKLLIVLGAVALLGAGCGSSGPATETVTLPDRPETPAGFSNHSTDEWTIAYPSDWEPVRNPDDLLQYFFATPYVESPDEFEHSVNITISPDQAEVLPLDELRSQVESLLLQVGASEITDSRTVLLPQAQAVRIEYKATSPDGEELFGTQVGLYDEDDLYVLTFTASQIGQEAFLADFEDMIMSFQVN